MVTIRNSGRRGGWTLIEVLVTLAIIGGVAMVGSQILTQATRVYVMGRAKLDLQRQARAAMYVITRELRQAQSNQITIDQASGQADYSRISFAKIQGTQVTIAQSGSSLLITEGNDITTLSKNLAYLAFTFPHSDDMTIVSVSMTLQEQIYGGLYKALHMASERVRVMN